MFNKKNLKISICGTGFVGGNILRDFVERGYYTIGYSLEPKYIDNKDKVKNANVVFCCLPTPTTPKGFDDSILINAIKETTTDGQIIVIKSTVQIGTTNKIQEMFPKRYIMHSPEFLSEATAYEDVKKPSRNIIGYTKKSEKYASKILGILPECPYNVCIPCKEAELIKYAGNCFYAFKIIAQNIFYDLAKVHGLDFELIKEANIANPFIANQHLEIYHKGKRGGSGSCIPKDFQTMIEMYDNLNKKGKKVLESVRDYNIELIKETGLDKDKEIFKGIYGDNVFDN